MTIRAETVREQPQKLDGTALGSGASSLFEITRQMTRSFRTATFGLLLGVLSVWSQPLEIHAAGPMETFFIAAAVNPHLHKLKMTWANRSNTVFQVQAQDAPGGPWRSVVYITGTSTNLTYVDEYATNSLQFYRVTALTDPPLGLTNLQQTLDTQTKLMGTKGAFAAVIHPEWTWVGTSGYSDPTNGRPIEPNMRVGVASNTKMMTAAYLLRLQEKGILSILDPIKKWLPGFSTITTNVSPETTIKSLLNHTGRVWDLLNDASVFPKIFTTNMSKVWTTEEMVHFAKKPSPPGWNYSNTGYSVAELVAVAAGGVSLPEGLRKEFFDPLNLPSIYFRADEEPTGEIVHEFTGYLGLPPKDVTAMDLTAVYSGIRAPAGASATALDMARFTRALYNGEFLHKDSMKLMTNWVSAPGWGAGKYGLGTQAFTTSKGEGYGHWADGWGNRGMIVHRPKDNVTLVLYLNTEYGLDNNVSFDRMQNGFYAIDRAVK